MLLVLCQAPARQLLPARRCSMAQPVVPTTNKLRIKLKGVPRVQQSAAAIYKGGGGPAAVGCARLRPILLPGVLVHGQMPSQTVPVAGMQVQPKQ